MMLEFKKRFNTEQSCQEYLYKMRWPEGRNIRWKMILSKSSQQQLDLVIAVDMEFVTAEQLKEAIIEQVEEDLADKPHRYTGEILLDNGWITKEQLDIVLKEL